MPIFRRRRTPFDPRHAPSWGEIDEVSREQFLAFISAGEARIREAGLEPPPKPTRRDSIEHALMRLMLGEQLANARLALAAKDLKAAHQALLNCLRVWNQMPRGAVLPTHAQVSNCSLLLIADKLGNDTLGQIVEKANESLFSIYNAECALGV